MGSALSAAQPLACVFERFGRADRARDGSGIGLGIASSSPSGTRQRRPRRRGRPLRSLHERD